MDPFSLLRSFDEIDPNSAENVGRAYGLMNEKLQRDEGTAEDNWWKERFKIMEDAGVAPSKLLDSKSRPPKATPLERWKGQIDAMIKSGNQTLQKEGMSQLAGYQSRAAQRDPTNDPPTSYQEYQLAVQRGEFEGSYPDWFEFRKQKQPRQYAPKIVTVPEAKALRWIDTDRKDQIVGKRWEDIEGDVRVVDDAEGMREGAQGVLDTLEGMLFNEGDGIYLDDIWSDEGFPGVFKGSFGGALKNLSQQDAYKAYTDLRDGSASYIVRAMGEKGALSDGDVKRALAMLPNISGTKGFADLPATAKLKFKYLRIMLRIPPSNWPALMDAVEAEIKAMPQAEGSEWEDT